MTKWKVCEEKECHLMVRYITGGEITVAVAPLLLAEGVSERYKPTWDPMNSY